MLHSAARRSASSLYNKWSKSFGKNINVLTMRTKCQSLDKKLKRMKCQVGLTGRSRSVRWGLSCSGRAPSGCLHTRLPPMSRGGWLALLDESFAQGFKIWKTLGCPHTRPRPGRYEEELNLVLLKRHHGDSQNKEVSPKTSKGSPKDTKMIVTFFLHFLMASSEARSVVENAKTQAWGENLHEKFF